MNGRRTISPRQPPRQRCFGVRISHLILVVLCGCGAPGEPQPPSPPVPAPITDLSARQQDNGVLLTFTLPARSVKAERLTETPAVEIFRAPAKPDGSVDNKSFTLVYTIPGAMAHSYMTQGKIQFTDPIAADELRAHPGSVYAYRVQTRVSRKQHSASSNMATDRVFPLAERIASLNAKVTQNAIELSWPVPAFAPAPNSSEIIARYHIYRGELDASAPLPSANDLSQSKWKSTPVLLASSQTKSYSDTLFEFGKSYVYQVRSVIIAEGNPIESDDSVPAIVTPQDTFAPAAPQNLIAVELPGENHAVSVDLSWSINSETDLAGYRLYRSESGGDRGALLQTDLLLSPAYHDASVQPEHRYWYLVTAVDRAGNESEPSEQIVVDLTQPLP